MIDNCIFWIWDSVAVTCSFSCNLLYKFLKQGAAEWSNLKNCDWRCNFCSMRPCYRYLTQFDFSGKLLFDSWCSISKSVNYVSDHCFQQSMISTGKSEYIMKFRFASIIISFVFADVALLCDPPFEFRPLVFETVFSDFMICRCSFVVRFF